MTQGSTEAVVGPGSGLEVRGKKAVRTNGTLAVDMLRGPPRKVEGAAQERGTGWVLVSEESALWLRAAGGRMALIQSLSAEPVHRCSWELLLRGSSLGVAGAHHEDMVAETRASVEQMVGGGKASKEVPGLTCRLGGVGVFK